ncbi:hypothetical protein L7F22_024510 [Adiantum nelumboides]|nr:hypothetical protein [Adiantum nelumboides]
MHRNDDATKSSPKFSKNRSQNGSQPCKHKLPHTGGRPTPSASSFDAVDDEDSNDEHASEGEGVEGADDEALEVEGPVLDDSLEGDNDFINAVPPEWNSGDGLEQEPHGTFRPLPPFNGIKGPNLGHLPHEFCEFHLFFMLVPLDLIDHIVSETNMYAKKERVRYGSLHDSMRRWVPIDRHSFLCFMGMALGMALHYMPSKRHYWKDEMVGSLVFPNFGEKMSQITFQQIKRFLHLRYNAQRPPHGSREHKLWQLVGLEEWLNYTFQKHYNVGKCVTVDERIIPSKCKLHPCRVYNPKKPHKFGIQVWNLCDSAIEYNYAFQIYDKLPCPELSFHAVAGLVKMPKRKGHHVFFDRFFTYVKLLEHLLSEGQGGTAKDLEWTEHELSEHIDILENIHETRLRIVASIYAQKGNMKSFFDHHVINKEFATGDYVLMYTLKQHSRKLKKRGNGPYVIHEISSSGAIKLATLEGEEMLNWISACRLKKYNLPLATEMLTKIHNAKEQKNKVEETKAQAQEEARIRIFKRKQKLQQQRQPTTEERTPIPLATIHGNELWEIGINV